MKKLIALFAAGFVVMLTTGCGTTPVGLNMEVRSSFSASGEGAPAKLFARVNQNLHNATRKYVCGDAPLEERRSARRYVETDHYYDDPRARHKKRVFPVKTERINVRSELRC